MITIKHKILLPELRIMCNFEVVKFQPSPSSSKNWPVSKNSQGQDGVRKSPENFTSVYQ